MDAPIRAVKTLLDQVRDLGGIVDPDGLDDVEAAAFIRAADRTRETATTVTVERTVMYQVNVALAMPAGDDFEDAARVEARKRILEAPEAVRAELTVSDETVAWIEP